MGTAMLFRPTRRNNDDDEIIIDNRSLREKLVALKCRVLDVAERAWSAAKDFVLGRPGWQRMRRKAKVVFALKVLAAVVAIVVAYVAWIFIFILLLEVSVWLGILWLVVGLWAIVALPTLYSY